MSAVLPSWNEGRSRQSILDFVARVTNEGGSAYVAPDARIAVFDNDGTLWCEKPVPIEMGFQLADIARQAADDPSLRERQP
jgi:hypothetical protein